MNVWDRHPGSKADCFTTPKRQHSVHGTDFTEVFFFETVAATAAAGSESAKQQCFKLLWQRKDSEGSIVLEGEGFYRVAPGKVWITVYQKPTARAATMTTTKHMLKKHYDDAAARFDSKTGVVALDEIVEGHDLDVDALDSRR
jgi:hypothetical protein